MQLKGIHHLTAISSDARGNHAFYTGTLGLRLVKKTVNQDDVSAYHLFYGDGAATPGSDITFFDWPMAPERRGSGSVVRTGLRVAGEDTLRWWARRLDEHGVSRGEVAVRDGRATLDFEDPEGQRLALVDDGGSGAAFPWEQSPVEAARQVHGLGPIVISVTELAPTQHLLEEVLAMRQARTYPHPQGGRQVHVFEMGDGGPAAELHVVVEPDVAPARQGAGGVHHVAFRCADTDYDAWADRLTAMRILNSGRIDRYYFRSLYLREPGGVLFEIATDGPGFTVDEPLESLGQKLSLPPFLEKRRAEIEAGLKPL